MTLENLKSEYLNRVEGWIYLTFFPIDPRDMFALLRVTKDDMNGETIYDGQVHRLFYDQEFRNILDMQVVGYIDRPESMSSLNWVFVKS